MPVDELPLLLLLPPPPPQPASNDRDNMISSAIIRLTIFLTMLFSFLFPALAW
jgi:hypothetical protein